MSRYWESICHCCGLCCHEKVVTPEFLLVDSSACCEHLDKASCRCRIYRDRFRISDRCRKVGLFKAMFSPALPASCGYVLWAERHHIRFVRERETVMGDGVLSQ